MRRVHTIRVIISPHNVDTPRNRMHNVRGQIHQTIRPRVCRHIIVISMQMRDIQIRVRVLHRNHSNSKHVRQHNPVNTDSVWMPDCPSRWQCGNLK